MEPSMDEIESSARSELERRGMFDPTMKNSG
jgi:hypothetical protein